MKQYLLSVIQPEGERPAPDVLAGIMQNVAAFDQDLRSSGAWVFNGGLNSPSTATVVQLRDGEMLTTDGPYAEAKEYLGGLVVVQAPDLDAALEWGRKAAQATTLPIEVRPFMDDSGN